ncbi:MAG: nickel-dependent hydrogenase large subunit, partial [Spirochaetia bacterium]
MQKSVISIGPFHPLQEEPEHFMLTVEGETVVDVEVDVGYNHRGIEKLSERRNFEQSTFVIERICGICSTSHPFAYTRAVEDIIPVVVPERAQYIRTIIAEGERIHSHLLWYGLAGHFLGYNTVYMWMWKLREEILDVLEILSGNRQNYAMFKPGGVRRDINADDIPVALKKIDSIIPTLDRLKKAILDDPVLHARLKGIGILSKEDAINYCTLGPTSRASGVDRDVRKDAPYAAYDKVDWDMIVTDSGDVWGKAVVRLLELYESIKIMKSCLQQLPPGEIDLKLKSIPPGEGIGAHEAPRGETFHYVRSDGTNRPVRHKVRAPTFMN